MIGTILVGTVAVIGFLALCVGGWFIGSYNTMVVAQQDMKTMWGNVKAEYQRRADLIINLANSVKGFMKHEKDTLTQVMQARAGNFGKTKAEEIKNMQGIDKTLNRLMLLSESNAYPNIKADGLTRQLMDDITQTEDRVNIVRTDYNNVVRDYNILIKVFPKNMIAGWFGFLPEIFYENDSTSDKAPVVNLQN